MKGYIYKITSPSNKIYIGQTKNIKHRISSYKTANCKTQTKLYNSIKKYGWELHSVEILEEIEYDKNILNILEIYYISIFDCLSESGLNIRPGGKNSTISDDGRKRLSERMLGDKNPMFGKKPWNYGNGLSDEERSFKIRQYYYNNIDKIKEYYKLYLSENIERIKEYRKNYKNPKSDTEEYKNKRRQSCKKWRENNKNKIKEYNTIYYISRKNN